jgi:predicted nucleic acid-binding protein
VILADTSIWVQHFRRGLPDFAAGLGQHQVSIHPVVLGELACGNLAQRAATLIDLRRLPRVTAGTVDESLDFIEAQALYGRGLGWNDVQLLVAARLSGHLLWSLDARLAAAALRVGVAYRSR